MKKHKLNGKNEGCYLCGSTEKTTQHHIRKGGFTLVVYLCWNHHQIVHGFSLGRQKEDESYLFPTEDLMMVLKHASEYRLFKYGETKSVRRKIQEEIRRRENEYKRAFI